MNGLRQMFVTAVCAAAMLGSCGDSAGSDRLVIAEDECSAGRYESARQLCEAIDNDVDADTVSVARLCRMAMLNARVAEELEDDANTATATRYLQCALQRDSDSVAAFFTSLEIDDRSRMALINQLSRAFDHPADSIVIIEDSTMTAYGLEGYPQ